MGYGAVRKERITATNTASMCMAVAVRGTGGLWNQMARHTTSGGSSRTAA
jgi:hypothetical protein